MQRTLRGGPNGVHTDDYLVTPIVWRPVGSTEARLGSIEFSAWDDPPVLVVVPKGYIGPTLVRRDLAIARRFAGEQRRPWSYVVDPTNAIPNPLNLVFFRSVRKLENVRSFVVVARRQPMRTIARLLVALGGPDAAAHGGADNHPSVVVRGLRVDDVAAVQAVEQAAGEMFRSVPDPRISQCADHSPMPEAALVEFAESGGAWVATADEVVVGFLVAKIVGQVGHVEEVAVLPEWNGRGVGSALLDRAAAWTADGGRPALTLTTFRGVPWNRPYYERRGFRVLAEDELDEAQRELVVEEEEQYGLVRELRVVMCRDLVLLQRTIDDPR